ncbi:MAG: WecB/TagA/CpsF family glycosyltransferase [Oculatellaceae cyanobacterium bins.114]|nr:WecB/TagA/CpsF family glycosyltransferase [Oculatellaceae cyanobacterium bins.114]
MRELAQPSLEKFAVFGLPLHLSNNYLGWLFQQRHQRNGVHVVTLNAEMSMQAEQNPTLASIIRQADLIIPDGSGIVFYLWLQGKKAQRCPGIELAESVLHASAYPASLLPLAVDITSAPYSVFFYGGAPGVCQQAAEIWQQKIPGLAIAGVQHGYISPEEQANLCQTLKTLQPDIILVGLGVPRQELWISENRHLCPHSIWIGVGGSFDIWAGVKTRAPKWLSDNGLEWMYRLYQEPWRWRRMLALPQFAWRSLLYSISKSRKTLKARV